MIHDYKITKVMQKSKFKRLMPLLRS